MFEKFIYEYDDCFDHHIKRVYTHTILDYEELTEDERFRIRVEIYKDDKLIHEKWLTYADGLESIVACMCSSDGEKTIVYQDDNTRDNEYKTAKIKLEES